MKTQPNSTTRRAGTRRSLPLLFIAAAAFAGAPFAQQPIQSQTYGQPSGGTPALGLSLTQLDPAQPALRLEGGEPGAPAFVCLGTAEAATQLPGGITLLVGSVTATLAGQFDAHGTFVCALGSTALDAQGGELFAQGMAPVAARSTLALSAGLRLQHSAPAEPPAPEQPITTPPETIFVEEVAAALRLGHLETALSQALNSYGDTLTLELSGNLEVPVYAAVTAGGKFAFKAAIQRGRDSLANPVYDVVIAADAAASAGVGAGVAGIGASAGAGIELVWRYASTHEVARALRSMAILQAVGPRLELVCLALDTQLDKIDRAVDSVRGLADRARMFGRSRMPWRDNAHVQRVRQQLDRQREARRAAIDRARRAVASLIGWVAQERIFLVEHMHGFERHSTVAAEVNVGTGFGDSKKGGQVSGVNFGASVAAGLERQFGLRVERIEESDAMFVQHKVQFTRSIAGSAGCGLGASAAAKRVIEITTKLQVGKDGLRQADLGTTVKISLDGKLLGAVGAIVAGQYGIGGEVAVELDMADLRSAGDDLIGILTGDDDQRIVDLLLAVPFKFEARGRYEAGIAAGFSIDLDGVFKGGIGVSAMMADRNEGIEFVGSGRDAIRQIVTKALRSGPMQRAEAGVAPAMQAVADEVARAMN